ncbi:MAG: DMT family transporter [Xanthobacteraceae bacterium]|nr:DMT family transporter [Xanthobacteraceae bacterium]
MNRAAIIYALISAALFGISTPAAKVLLGAVDPVVLAGLLYCGAGFGAAILRRVGSGASSDIREARLSRKDMPWLTGAIAAGGIAGPMLLMLGLAKTDGATASLLLTLEGAATALIAWFVFHENFDRRIALGMASLVLGAAILAWTGSPSLQGALGPLAIAGACIAWGLDNNLMRKVSLADPLQVVELKGMIAGPVNIALGLWAGGSLPAIPSLFIALVVGFLGYGVSLALFVAALRHLGAARTSAYFSAAPFFGAAVAVVALGYPLTGQLIAGGALMAIGIWLHLSEHHEHDHLHEPMTHTHSHTHDEHHQHAHSNKDPAGEPHTHVHTHAKLRHTHAHTPDMHHVHRH